MAAPVLIYGATGFTGRLIVDAARKLGMAPVLAGRDPVRVEQLARSLGLDYRIASLSQPGELADALRGMSVVLNAAGPFVATVRPLLQACLQVKASYLDISGELDALEQVAASDQEARTRGVMLLPGVGFDIVPSDCLCAYVARRAARPSSLRIAVSGLELMSPGSGATLSAELGRATRVRRAGRLQEVPPGELTRSFDFGSGPRLCAAVTWGDLACAHFTTGIENVETYFELTPAVAVMLQSSRYGAWFFNLPGVREALARQAKLWTPEPGAADRERRRATIVAEVEEVTGKRVVARLTTPEAYTLTGRVAAEVLRRVAAADLEPGFQTPARLLGPQFILGFEGVQRMDVENRN